MNSGQEQLQLGMSFSMRRAVVTHPHTRRRSNKLTPISRMLFLAATLWLSGNAVAVPTEYAIRWSPADGGPKNIAEVMQFLKFEPKKKVHVFEVRYYRAETPGDGPANVTSIVRERLENVSPEVTWKYRSVEPLPGSAKWSCPLSSTDKAKFEADISVMDTGVRKTFSWSCSASGAFTQLVPAELKVTPLGCGSQMTRSEAKGTEHRIEEWRLKNGTIILEVSWTATDDRKDQELFLNQVANPLLSKIKPQDRSKTEIVSNC